MPYFKAKCTKFDFGWGSASGAHSASPYSLAEFEGSFFLRKKGEDR